MKDSEALRRLLNQRFALRQQHSFSDPQLQQRLNELRQRLSPPRGHHSLPRIAQGVLAFRIQGRETPYPQLKYACYGIARPTDWNNRLIIEDKQLFEALLNAVNALKQSLPHAYTTCCQALQTSLEIDLPSLEPTQSLVIQQNCQKLSNLCAQLASQQKNQHSSLSATVHPQKYEKP